MPRVRHSPELRYSEQVLSILRGIRSQHGYAVYQLALDRVLRELMAEPTPQSVVGLDAGPGPWLALPEFCEVCYVPGHPQCNVYWCKCPCKAAVASESAA